MSVASLYTGISGINANLKVLSVIGNNIANINTFGFKGSRVAFADILSQSLTGSSQIGLGVKLSSIQKSFTQGAFQATNNILDLGISGDGFYMVNDPVDGSPFYSRAGMFHLDKDGYIVNPEALKLQGYMANSSGVLQNTVTDLIISGATIPPNTTNTVTITANLDSNSPVTGFVLTAANADIYFSDDNGTTYFTADLITDGGLTSGAANTGAAVATAIETALEAQSGTDTYTVTYDDQTGLFTIGNDVGNGVLLLEWSHANTTAEVLLGFDTVDSTIAAAASDESDNAGGAFVLASAGDTSNFSTPVTVYDSLGNSHVVTMYFRKDSLGGTGNVWEWFATVPASDSTSGNQEIQANGTATFNTSGALYQESSITYPTGGFDFTGGPAQDQAIVFDYGLSIVQGGSGATGTTQYGTNSGVAALAQDGYASGTLGSIAVAQDGVISGVYSNGRTLTLAQVLLASFAATEALQSAGNNVYTESYDSGQPLIGAPGSSSRGFVQSNTLELSNVDMAEQFVGMITAQRGFQASSRVITTTDDLLAELVNLKR
jgi:flagellar hook protein FlgE